MDQLGIILSAVLPPFGIVAVGYLFQRLRPTDPKPIVDLAMYLAVPCLAYVSILEASMPLGDVGGIVAAASGVLVGGGLVGWVALRLARIESRGLLLPIIFMNAANLPLPIALELWGVDGEGRAVVFYLTVLVFLYTGGMAIACGKADWKRLLVEPVIVATALALFMKGMEGRGWRTPDALWTSVRLLKGAAIPLILLVLGMQLREVKLTAVPIALYATGIRMGAGLALGLLMVWALGLDGLARKVVLLGAPMPSAMIAAAISSRFDCDPDLVAATVMTSTIAGLFALPAILYFIIQ